MAKIELDDEEEVINKTVDEYGRVTGLMKYKSRSVKIIVLKKEG